MVDWSPERVAALSVEDIKALRINAEKNGASDLVNLCEAELVKRRPPRLVRAKTTGTRSSKSDTVYGFHFTCDRERGVTKNADGTVWTGVWVVDKVHAERAAKIGAYVALHESKVEQSYLQGIVKDWRMAPRDRQYAEDRETKIKEGVEFLLELTPKSHEWVGDGTGEKGYNRIPPSAEA